METWEDKNNLDNLDISSLTLVRTANDCIEGAEGEAELKPLFGTFWQAGELTFLAGDTGKGKTILSVAIADALTKGLDKFLQQNIEYKGTVLYYDFELSDRQFRKRYQNYRFADQFYRVVINPDYLGMDLFTIDTIERDIEAIDAQVIIIDNITALALKSTQSQDAALSLMRGLKKLALRGLSILVLAHTPKIAEGRKLSINHLAGSKHLSNFADSVFFIGHSNENPDYRYLKQVKCRNADQLHDVIVCELVNDNGHLSFEFVKYDREETHVISPIPVAGIEVTEDMQKAFELNKQGKSLRAIAKELGVGKSTVDRWLKSRPMSQMPENSLSESVGQPKDNEGQVKNEQRTIGTGGHIKPGTDIEQKTTEKAEQKIGQMLQEKEIDMKDDRCIQDKTYSGTRGQRDNASKSLQNGIGTTGQNHITRTEGQQDSKKDLPPPTIEIIRNGKKITVEHPELLAILHGENWMDILYPEKDLQKAKREKVVYEYYDKGKVEKVNKELKKWILKLLRFINKGEHGIEVSEFKTIVENIKEMQNTFDYKYLPKNYEYFDFIENLKEKLQRTLITAKVENIKIFQPRFDKDYLEEMKQVLYDVEG